MELRPPDGPTPNPFLALLIPTITATLSNPLDSTGLLSVWDNLAAMVDLISTAGRALPPSAVLANVMSASRYVIYKCRCLFSVLKLHRTNASLVKLHKMSPAAQASAAVPPPMSLHSLSTPSKSPSSSTATWSSTTVCPVDPSASRLHLAARAELLSRTPSAVVLRTSLSSTQASLAERALAPSAFIALDSTATPSQAHPTPRLRLQPSLLPVLQRLQS